MYIFFLTQRFFLHQEHFSSKDILDPSMIFLCAALELVADRVSRKPFPPKMGVGAYFCERARYHGVIVRAVGTCIY